MIKEAITKVIGHLDVNGEKMIVKMSWVMGG